MAGELEKRVREMMHKMDAKDWDSLNQMATDDLRGVDEISKRWIDGLHTELRDMKETTWGEVGLVTCWIEQDYTYQGKPQHISAPTTLLFRRMGSDWRLALFHSVPLPEAS